MKDVIQYYIRVVFTHSWKKLFLFTWNTFKPLRYRVQKVTRSLFQFLRQNQFCFAFLGYQLDQASRRWPFLALYPLRKKSETKDQELIKVMLITYCKCINGNYKPLPEKLMFINMKILQN